MLASRLRRLPNVKPALCECLVFAWRVVLRRVLFFSAVTAHLKPRQLPPFDFARRVFFYIDLIGCARLLPAASERARVRCGAVAYRRPIERDFRSINEGMQAGRQISFRTAGEDAARGGGGG